MKEIVLRAGPGTAVQFPGRCVHCDKPASAMMPIQTARGYLARRIGVPLCAGCDLERRRLSAAEERQQKLRLLLLALLLPVLFALVLLVTPAAYSFLLRLLIAAVSAVAVGGIIWLVFQVRLPAAALPEKQAIRTAARIRHFSRGRTTFAFANPSFSARFLELNHDRVVETPSSTAS